MNASPDLDLTVFDTLIVPLKNIFEKKKHLNLKIKSAHVNQSMINYPVCKDFKSF